MSGQIPLNPDLLSWLLDPANPGVRYLAMRDLLDCPESDREFQASREAAYTQGPIAAVLDAMNPEGYWVEPGPGYWPKYTSNVWSLILLAQLGANLRQDRRIERACTYFLDHGLAPGGQVSASGAPSGTADCMQGNLCWALLELGCEDPRLDLAFEWMARSVTGEGVAPSEDRQAPLRYYAGKCGPRFACGSNDRQGCAWGGAKVMLAFSRLPEEGRTPLILNAIREGVEFFFSVDPATAAWPSGYSEKPSGNWWKFGFPVFYVTDLLQVVEAQASLGYAHDPRLANTWELVRGKADAQGRWVLEYDYTGKTWADFGSKKQPNPWVTLRALKTLRKY